MEIFQSSKILNRGNMKKLNKTFGDVNSKECEEFRLQVETQSRETIGRWALNFFKNRYFVRVDESLENREVIENLILSFEKLLNKDIKLAEHKEKIKEATDVARHLEGKIIDQSIFRMASTCCSSFHNPTSSMGFMFYASAFMAYSELGLEEKRENYEKIATREFLIANEDFRKIMVKDEKNIAKIRWNC